MRTEAELRELLGYLQEALAEGLPPGVQASNRLAKNVVRYCLGEPSWADAFVATCRGHKPKGNGG